MSEKGYKVFNYVYGAVFISCSMILVWLIPQSLNGRLINEFAMVFINLMMLYYLQDNRMGKAKMRPLLWLLAIGIAVLFVVLAIDSTWTQVFKYLLEGKGGSALEQLAHVNGDVFVLVGLGICYAACVAIVRRVVIIVITRYWSIEATTGASHH